MRIRFDQEFGQPYLLELETDTGKQVRHFSTENDAMSAALGFIVDGGQRAMIARRMVDTDGEFVGYAIRWNWTQAGLRPAD